MEKIGAFTDRVTSAGEWRNGDPASNVRATPMLAAYFNMLQRELVAVIEGAGLELDIGNDGQLFQAIASLASGNYLPRLATIPAQRLAGADEIYVAGWGEMVWTETEFFIGYRSPLCGRPVDGHTANPLVRELDAVGGLASKEVYAGLWGYAREQGLVVTQAEWETSIGAHLFVDVNATQFRLPDLRNMFRRYTGTDADTANARALGSRQFQSLQAHSHGHGGGSTASGTSGGAVRSIGPGTYSPTAEEGTAETRPENVAFPPRLHV
ncbi:hypothetical protein [Bordetella petrii]|uniref:Tail fiber protein, putative n=1 Tax=Bordetella petrii (strain ATCC BAA-461 / DSM 12804 / CCUG 43448 / CIP 107267 / Se-1111R) TaxID=340100 RepID=A9ID89_BORPD|nr:hypothetical protein [Bordetella petrii]CAP44780.1 tail fiber protein, putative [Bordetella petrii]